MLAEYGCRYVIVGHSERRAYHAESDQLVADKAKVALAAAVRHYGDAEQIALRTGADNLFYPARNAISAQVRSALLAHELPELDPARLKLVSDSMTAAAAARPDFWSFAGQSELLILQAITEGRLAPASTGIVASLTDLKGRVPAPKSWDSVYNEAQFTLLPYLAFAKGAEKKAAQDLLDLDAGQADIERYH